MPFKIGSIIFVVTIPFQLPSLNELLAHGGARSGMIAAKKRKFEDDIIMLCRAAQAPKVDRKISLCFTFYESTKKRDWSNVISGGIKIIEDALVRGGFIKGDGQRHLGPPSIYCDNGPRTECMIVAKEFIEREELASP